MERELKKIIEHMRFESNTETPGWKGLNGDEQQRVGDHKEVKGCVIQYYACKNIS